MWQLRRVTIIPANFVRARRHALWYSICDLPGMPRIYICGIPGKSQLPQQVLQDRNNFVQDARPQCKSSASHIAPTRNKERDVTPRNRRALSHTKNCQKSNRGCSEEQMFSFSVFSVMFSSLSKKKIGGYQTDRWTNERTREFLTPKQGSSARQTSKTYVAQS